MEGKRKPRFKSTPTRAIKVGDRDLEIVRRVFEHRFLNTNEIIALTSPAYSAKTTRERLRLLYDHRYLDLPNEQRDYYAREGNRPNVFAVGNKGADLLKEELGIPRAKVDWRTKNRELGRIYLKHGLLASEIMVAIELGCRAFENIRLIDANEILNRSPAETRRRENPLMWRVAVKQRGKSRGDLPVQPDRIFALEFLDTGHISLFFLEADRSTMTVMPGQINLYKSTYFRKMIGYFETWAMTRNKPPKPAAHGYGIAEGQGFRVLTFTKTRERFETMISAGKNLGHGEGYRMFLFADRRSLDKENPLEFLWTNGRGELERLID